MTNELPPLHHNEHQGTSKENETWLCNILLSKCQHVFNERTGTPFNSLESPTDVVLLAVLWRLRYKLRLRDVAEVFQRTKEKVCNLQEITRPDVFGMIVQEGGPVLSSLSR